MKALKAIWAGIQAVLHFIGRIMTVVLLTVIYAVIVVPWGLLLAITGQRPLYKGQPEGSTWRDRPAVDSSLDEAAKPY
jgi:hypothetical protein